MIIRPNMLGPVRPVARRRESWARTRDVRKGAISWGEEQVLWGAASVASFGSLALGGNRSNQRPFIVTGVTFWQSDAVTGFGTLLSVWVGPWRSTAVQHAAVPSKRIYQAALAPFQQERALDCWTEYDGWDVSWLVQNLTLTAQVISVQVFYRFAELPNQFADPTRTGLPLL